MKISKNDILTLKVLQLNNLGFGVARYGGFVVFVDGAVSGEVVLAKVIKVTSSYAVAKLEKILEPSEHRTDSRCHLSACKSCAYKWSGNSEEDLTDDEEDRPGGLW